MKYPLVRVVWKDASDIGNESLERMKMKQPPIFEDVGYLIDKNKERIILTHHIQTFDDKIGDTDKNSCQGTLIMNDWIITIKKIKVCLPKRLKKIVNKIQ